MKILSFRAIDGPNVYIAKPIVIATLDLEDLAGRETREFGPLNDRLIRSLPGLHEHGCAAGTPGAFIERLRTGTYFGHVIEHVALELSHAAGMPANFGKTRVTSNPRVYDLIVESPLAPATRCLIQLAADIVGTLIDDETFPALDARLAAIRRVIDRYALGPSTRAIVAAASRRGIPITRLGDDSLVQLGYGRARRLVQATVANTTSAIAVEVASDKQLTRELLSAAFLPAPHGGVAATEEEALALFEESGGPVAVKPRDGNQGRGITLEVADAAALRTAYRKAREISRDVIVEEMLHGRDYRVLVIDGRLVAASEREPASVIGDGRRCVAELVDDANRDPRRGECHEKPLTRIRLDERADHVLAAQGLAPERIPAAGARVRLRDTANLSTGGTARDVTADVHPDVAAMCERAARVIGLDICGLDLIVPDIAQPIPSSGAGIVEVNAGPGIRMHHHPSEGAPRDAGAAIVDMLFPEGNSGRIPIAAITGTNGKTTTARMLAHIMQTRGTVGLTTTDGVYIARRQIARGDMTGPRSARVVLGDPSIDVAVLETARGGIVRGGLGYDWSDVGIVTNIQLDHIGQDGIEDIDDLVYIKSLVAERVRAGGTLVLNADDEQSSKLAEHRRVARLDRTIIYYTMHARRRRIEDHLARGGTAYFPRNGWIVEARGTVLEPVCRIGSIPATLGGAAVFNIGNAMAAAAAGRALGASTREIAQALQSFGSDRNPGRASLFAVGNGYVLLDYGHNPAAFEAVGRMTARWRGRRITGIVGLPGDRLDSVVREASAMAARVFDRVFVREDHDLRGRRRGELAAMIAAEIGRVKADCDCVIVRDERAALAEAVESMQPAELIVLFYDEFDAAEAALQDAGATPIAGGLTSLPREHSQRRVAQAEAADRLRRQAGAAAQEGQVPCNRAV